MRIEFSQRSAEIWITFYNRFSAGFLTAGGSIGGAGTKGLYQFMISDSKCVLNNVAYNPVHAEHRERLCNRTDGYFIIIGAAARSS